MLAPSFTTQGPAMKHIKLIASAFVLSSLCLGVTVAQAESKPSAQYQKCMDSVDLGAMKNSQWAACAAQELKRQDATLNAEYNKLRKALSAEQKEALTKAQKSWLKFREDWCRFEEVGPSAPGGEANYNFCVMELTNKQIDKIKESQP